MNNRSHSDAADEYERLNFLQSVSRFTAVFTELSLGDLMALGGRFLDLAHGLDGTIEDEQRTSACIAEAIEEVIIHRLAGNEDALKNYFAAKQAQLTLLRDHYRTDGTPLPDLHPSASGVFGWFGKKK
jgi:hypothetical protein